MVTTVNKIIMVTKIIMATKITWKYSHRKLMHAEMHVDLHVKCPLLLNFYQYWNVLMC
jgi:hypothetical protein